MSNAFTFSQLAIILLVIIGLVAVITIALVLINKYNDNQILSNSASKSEDAKTIIESCTSYGGVCQFGCVGKIDLGTDFCTGGKNCCI